jgi:hypothetical protein
MNRRRFLGGAGALLALPFFESLVRTRGASAAPTPPPRLIFYFVPNGIHMPAWTPKEEGQDYTLPPILKPLEPLRSEVLVISGLDNKPGRPDGAGDHAGGTSAFLTCAHALKSETELRLAISVDQVAAAKLGQDTRFSSLQLACEGGGSAGGCDSGYSCAYNRNISWAGPRTPLPKTAEPQLAFDLMFGGTDAGATQAERERRRRYRKSVIDYVLTDARRLRLRLGGRDQQKLDEYLSSVRDVEQKATAASCQMPAPPSEDVRLPAQSRAMCDLMVLALSCDLTRVISFMLGNGASYRSYPFLGISGSHHELSHHQNQPEVQAQLQAINTWEVEQLAYLLKRLAEVKDGAGTLLDSTLVYFSSEVADGNRHEHTNLPVVLGGRLGGAVRPGRHLVRSGVPMANLFTSILRGVGVPADRFGDDGTGPLDGLA